MVIDNIIEYLQAKIDADDELPEIKVLEAYTYGHKLKTSEVQVQFSANTEYSRFTSFNGIEVSVCPLIINVYGTQTDITKTVGNETVTETLSAQRFSTYLAQKIIKWLDYTEITAIDGVIGGANSNYIPGLPFDTGTLLYQSVVRADLYLEKI